MGRFFRRGGVVFRSFSNRFRVATEERLENDSKTTEKRLEIGSKTTEKRLEIDSPGGGVGGGG